MLPRPKTLQFEQNGIRYSCDGNIDFMDHHIFKPKKNNKFFTDEQELPNNITFSPDCKTIVFFNTLYKRAYGNFKDFWERRLQLVHNNEIVCIKDYRKKHPNIRHYLIKPLYEDAFVDFLIRCKATAKGEDAAQEWLEKVKMLPDSVWKKRIDKAYETWDKKYFSSFSDLAVDNDGYQIAFSDGAQVLVFNTQSGLCTKKFEIPLDKATLYGNIEAMAFNQQGTVLGIKLRKDFAKTIQADMEPLQLIRLSEEKDFTLADYLEKNKVCKNWNKQVLND
jgi:hypothetical protein